MKSTEFIERLSEYRVNILEDFEALEDFMFTTGKVGTGKAVDDLKIRSIYDRVIELYISNLPITYTEYAKITLLDMMEALSIKRFKTNTNMIYSVMPLYALSGEYEGGWSYVDISDAYFSIYKRFLNCKYKRMHYLSDEITLNFPDISKRVKRAIFGLMRGGSIRRYRREDSRLTFQFINVYQPYNNPNLVNLTYDILQAIAVECVKRYNAIYFNTDGAIIPSDRVDDYQAFLKELGFESKIKAGGRKVIVKAVGVYNFDNEYKTLNFDRVGFRSHSNLITQDEAKWILTMWMKKVK